jgi:hypothetical protein
MSRIPVVEGRLNAHFGCHNWVESLWFLAMRNVWYASMSLPSWVLQQYLKKCHKALSGFLALYYNTPPCPENS